MHFPQSRHSRYLDELVQGNPPPGPSCPPARGAAGLPDGQVVLVREEEHLEVVWSPGAPRQLQVPPKVTFGELLMPRHVP